MIYKINNEFEYKCLLISIRVVKNMPRKIKEKMCIDLNKCINEIEKFYINFLKEVVEDEIKTYERK